MYNSIDGIWLGVYLLAHVCHMLHQQHTQWVYLGMICRMLFEFSLVNCLVWRLGFYVGAVCIWQRCVQQHACSNAHTVTGGWPHATCLSSRCVTAHQRLLLATGGNKCSPSMPRSCVLQGCMQPLASICSFSPYSGSWFPWRVLVSLQGLGD